MQGGGSGGGAAPPREQTLNRGPNDMVVCVCNLPYERGSGGSGAPGEAKGAAGEAKVGLWKASVFALRQATYGWFRKKWLWSLREAIFIFEKLDLNWTPGGRSGRPGRASKNVHYHFFGR